MVEDLNEAKKDAIIRRLNKPKYPKDVYWYKVNPYTKRKVFVSPPQGELPDHIKQMMLKELLKVESYLRKERKRKLVLLNNIPLKDRWFFETLEAAEFAEYYLIQKWINKLIQTKDATYG